MRKLLLVVVAVALAALLAAPRATAQTDTGDSVIGTASFVQPVGPPPFAILFSFSARSGPSGENPTGTATWEVRSPFGDFGGGGPVTCLNVTGSAAIIATFSSGRATFFSVDDGGTGPDRVGFGAFDTASAPTVCSIFFGLPFSQFFEPRAMTSSAIAIHDAPPLPTSKDQCKNGGWHDFPDFRNQGDCVSFVATKGNNPPARP
jgi:hypothetical protein